MHSKRDERMIEWMMEFCLFKKMPSVVAGAFCAAIPFVFCALTLRAPARRSFGRICVGRNAGEERAAHDAHVARVDGALGSLRSEFGRTFATASRTFVFFLNRWRATTRVSTPQFCAAVPLFMQICNDGSDEYASVLHDIKIQVPCFCAALATCVFLCV